MARTVLSLEEIDDSGRVRGDVVVRVVGHPEEISSDGRDIVRLARVRNARILRESDTFLRDGLKLLVRSSDGVVGVLEPDLDESASKKGIRRSVYRKSRTTNASKLNLHGRRGLEDRGETEIKEERSDASREERRRRTCRKPFPRPQGRRASYRWTFRCRRPRCKWGTKQERRRFERWQH